MMLSGGHTTRVYDADDGCGYTDTIGDEVKRIDNCVNNSFIPV